MSNKAEYRKHYYLDEVVLIAPKRAHKPQSYKNKYKLIDHHLITCPFCNNTSKFNYIITDNDGWTIKVLDNLYPAVSTDNPLAYGIQEVIIETPNHNQRFCEFSVVQIKNLLSTYQNRINNLKQVKNIKYVSVFKNYGPEAAASISHSHSQVFGLPIIPTKIEQERAVLKEYKLKNHGCAICDLLKKELSLVIRIVGENDSAVIFTPYCSSNPYEVWILPKKHHSSFVGLSAHEIADFAEIIKISTRFLEDKNIDFNLTVEDLASIYGHTYIKIIPRISRPAGFELNTGIYINPIAPEYAANLYRQYFSLFIRQTARFARLR